MHRTADTAKRARQKMPRFLFAVFFCLLALSRPAKAAPLRDVPTTLAQPDGSVVSCYSSGDERLNYLHDSSGALIVQDEQGWYVYAREEDGRAVPTGDRVGSPAPYSALFLREPAARMTAGQLTPQPAAPQAEPAPAFGEASAAKEEGGSYLCNLVVFLRFQGEEEFLTGPAAAPTANNMDLPVAYEKVRQYFRTISQGELVPKTVILTADPSGEAAVSYQDSHPRSYYQPASASNPGGYPTNDNDKERTLREMVLLENALEAALPSLPAGTLLDGDGDGRIDNITFIAGGGTSGWNQILWPHNWALQRREITVVDGGGEEKLAYNYNFAFASPAYSGVGVLSHELLHAAGFPDLYRYDESTGQPVGAWDVMGSVNGTDPQFPTAYTARAYGGWGSLGRADRSGEYTLAPVGSGSSSPSAYVIPTGDPNQFLVAEYRKSGTFGDVTQDNVPRDGLLVYRVDRVTSQGNQNGGLTGGDEVYVFRPGDAAPNAGTALGLPKAALSDRWGSAALGSADSAAPAAATLYLRDGANSRVKISQVREEGGKVSFRLDLPEEENLVPPGTYDLSARDYTLSQPGEYRFTGSTGSHGITVSAEAQDVTVILENVQADLSSTEYGAPLHLRRGAAAQVVLEGESSLTGGRYQAAVLVEEGASLTLEGPGALTAVGGDGAAAVGSSAFAPAGEITLDGASLTAWGGGPYRVQGAAASLSGESAPALGGGYGQTSGNITLRGASLSLTVSGEAALSTCALGEEYRRGGDVTVSGSTLRANGSLWAGETLALTDSRVTVDREEESEYGCLEAESAISLKNCQTSLNGGSRGSAMGGRWEGASLSVSGGFLRAVSAEYPLQGRSIALDDTAGLFLSSGREETLFSGLSSGGKPIRVQPGLPQGSSGRARLIQCLLPEPLGAAWSLDLYRGGVRLEGLSLPAGCTSFLFSVPGEGDYTLRAPSGERSQAIPSSLGVVRVSSLSFSADESPLSVLDLSSGPVSITKSGEYVLTGSGSTVTVGAGLSVTLRLRGARLAAPSGQPAVSAGEGSSLALVTEEAGESRLIGGSGQPAVKSEGPVSFQGTGRLLVVGGGKTPAVSASALSAERGGSLLLASGGESPLSLPEGAPRSFRGAGLSPILLTGTLRSTLPAGTSLSIRGAGEVQSWTLPSSLRSFCASLSDYGPVVLATDTLKDSDPLPCFGEDNVFTDLQMATWASATQSLDLSAGDVVISQNGAYTLTGSTGTHTVTVEDGVTALIHLKDLRMVFSAPPQDRKGLIQLGRGCDVTLLAESGQDPVLTNKAAGSRCALVYVPAGSRLTVDCQGTLALVPGGRGAALGAPEGEEAGVIRLMGGQINCTVDSEYKSKTLLGGEGSQVILSGAQVTVGGSCHGAVGGARSQVEVSGGSLVLQGGASAGTIGGPGSRVELSGGWLSLTLESGCIGVGGENAQVEVTGGTVSVTASSDRMGAALGIGGDRSLLRFTGGGAWITSGWAKCLGGEGACLYAGDRALLGVTLKKSADPLADGTILDPAMTGGFLRASLARTPTAAKALTVGRKSLTLPAGHLSFFLALPQGAQEIADSTGSGGAALIRSRETTLLMGVTFDRLAGVYLADQTVTYNGAAHTLHLTGSLPDDVQVEYTQAAAVLPGEYPVRARITGDGIDYTLSAVLTVEKAPLQVTGAAVKSKTYDGTCWAQGSLAALSGAQGGDQPKALADFTFTDSNAGRGKPVRVSNVRLEPEWEDRYTLSVPSGVFDRLTAAITPAPVSVALREETLVQPAGEAFPVEARTSIPGLSCSLSYDGSSELPQEPGEYPVTATVDSLNYTGSASGTLSLVEPLDLSAGDVELSAPGNYVVTGSTDTHRILVRGDLLSPGDQVSLCLWNASIALSQPGAVPLEITGGGEAALSLLFPQGGGADLRAGPGAPALVNPDGMALELLGGGPLTACGGQDQPPLALEGAPLAFLAFDSPAGEETALTWGPAGEAARPVTLPQGCQSILLSRDPQRDYVLRDAAGNRLCCLEAGEQTAVGLSLASPQEVERELDLTGAGRVELTQDGTYYLTGNADGCQIVTAPGLEATLVFEGVTGARPEGSGPLLVCDAGSRVTVQCRSDSSLDLGSAPFAEQADGASLGLEGPGALALSGSGSLFPQGEVQIAGPLSLELSGPGPAFNSRVSLTSGGELSLALSGAGAVGFGPEASLAADGGRGVVEVSGENAVGFSHLDLSLSGDAALSLAVTGPQALGVDLEAGDSQASLAGNASFAAFSTEEAACVRGEELSGQASLLWARLQSSLESPGLVELTRDSDQRSLRLPQEAVSFLALLPADGDWDLSWLPEAGDPLFAQLSVEPGLSSREVAFELLPEIEGPVLPGFTAVYDREEHSLSVSGLPAGASVSYQGNGRTKPGEYTVAARVTRPGFRPKELSGSLVIEKRLLSVTATAQDKPVYDGSTAAQGTLALTGALPGDAPQAQGTFTFRTADVGLHKLVDVTELSFVEDENHWEDYYALPSEPLQATASILAKARAELSFREGTLAQEYGGVTGAVVDGAGEMAVRVLYRGQLDVPTLPGTYPVTAELENTNWFGSVSGQFQVLPRTLTLTGLRAPELTDRAEGLSVTFTDSQSFDLSASGVLEGDSVLLNGTATYPDLAPGEKTVAFTGLTLSGEQAERYRLSATEAQGSGTVRREGTSNPGGEPDPAPGPDDPDDPGPDDPGPDDPDDPEDPPRFSDIQGHWAQEDILAVEALGLMTGTGEGRFQPQQPMSRAMLMTVLFRLDGAGPQESPDIPYSDVAPDSWYAPYVAWASASGVAAGMDDGTFRPNAPVSREQIAVFLYRFTQHRGSAAPAGAELAFPDSGSVSPWAEEALGWAVGEGIVNGRANGLLDPKGAATRAEVAVLLRRYLASQNISPAP